MFRVCCEVSRPDLPYASTVDYFELSLINIIILTYLNNEQVSTLSQPDLKVDGDHVPLTSGV